MGIDQGGNVETCDVRDLYDATHYKFRVQQMCERRFLKSEIVSVDVKGADNSGGLEIKRTFSDADRPTVTKTTGKIPPPDTVLSLPKPAPGSQEAR